MLEETRMTASGVSGDPLMRWLSATLLSWRMPAALLAMPAMLVLYLVVYEQALLAELPPYPAVILAFFVIVVLPGLFLQQALLQGQGPVVRLAVAPALGLALAVVPGLVALERHLTLADFSTMHAIVVAIACGLSILFWRGDADTAGTEPEMGTETGNEGRAGSLLLLALVGIVLAGVMTVPFWASERLSGDFDDWTYLGYVREYLDTDQINAEEPFLGTGEAVNPRMRSNVWVVVQALISDITDVPPHEVLLEYLRPLLIVFVALATYALTRALFRSATVALLAVAFQLGYAFLDMSAHEGFGRNLFLRISEDKMIGAFLLFPIALLFLTRFVTMRSASSYIGFALTVMAISVVHPVPLVFLATAIASLGALRALTERSLGEAGWASLLLLPVGLASIWPFLQRQLLVDVAPDLFATGGGIVTFRDEFHFVELGAGLLMGNYHMIMHPLVLAAIILAPVVWWLARRNVGNQLVAALTLGSLTLFFFPPLATPLAEVMTPQTLWKIPWMIPMAPILAYLTYQAALRLPGLRPLRWFGGGSVRARFVAGAAPAVIVITALVVALVVQEQYLRADGGSFYNWTSEETLLPGNDESIFLGGIDRAFSENWRIQADEKLLFDYMGRKLLSGSVVLAEPTGLHHMIPGMLTEIYPLDFGGIAGAGERRDAAMSFAAGTITPEELEAVVDRYGIDYIVVREVQPANDIVREFDRALWIQEISPYQIYLVGR